MVDPCRVGKGGGTALPREKRSRTPCPRDLFCKNAWARRTRGIAARICTASAFAHPTTVRVDPAGAADALRVPPRLLINLRLEPRIDLEGVALEHFLLVGG